MDGWWCSQDRYSTPQGSPIQEPLDHGVWPPFGYTEGPLGIWSPIDSTQNSQSRLPSFQFSRVPSGDCGGRSSPVLSVLGQSVLGHRASVGGDSVHPDVRAVPNPIGHNRMVSGGQRCIYCQRERSQDAVCVRSVQPESENDAGKSACATDDEGKVYETVSATVAKICSEIQDSRTKLRRERRYHPVWSRS